MIIFLFQLGQLFSQKVYCLLHLAFLFWKQRLHYRYLGLNLNFFTILYLIKLLIHLLKINLCRFCLKRRSQASGFLFQTEEVQNYPFLVTLSWLLGFFENWQNLRSLTFHWSYRFYLIFKIGDLSSDHFSFNLHWHQVEK